MKIFRNRRIKGAVSIFLVIITIPTMLLSAVLIDGSRMASARAMAQEATDLAASSVLAGYNQILKDQFGLFALDESDGDKVKSIFQESLNATLLAYGMSGNSEYSERLWDIMKTTLTGQKSYMGESFLNLYDFKVDDCTVEPLYSLANQSVLESQMVEYSKFRGLYVMADRMDIFRNLGNLKEEAKKNEETSEVMEGKMDADEKNAAADQELKALRDEIETLNEKLRTVKTAQEQYFVSLRANMVKIRVENTDTEETLSSSERTAANAYERNRRDLKTAAGEACRQAGDVLKQAQKAKDEVEKAIGRLEDFQSQNQGKASDNESVQELIKDAQENIDFYNRDYLPEIQNLLQDPVLEQMKQDSDIQSNLEQVMEDIDEAITKYIEVIEEMRESQGDDEDDDEEDDEITEYYYYFVGGAGSTTDEDQALERRGASKGYKPAVNQYLDYFVNKQWDPEKVNPSRKYKGISSDSIDESIAEDLSGKTGDSEEESEEASGRRKVEDAVYNKRPSAAFSSDPKKENNTNFFNKESDLTASKNILNQGKHSMILDAAETVRDDVLCLTYMFGTFKTRLTGVEKFSSEGMPDGEKNSFYMPKWRYAHPDGELDMRLDPKKDRDTVLRSEVEYLVYGNQSDMANEAAVYATIFAERLANNLIVMYMHEDIKAACHAAAAAASVATAGVVPETVFFWIFLTAWATAETILEMNYLISDGYRVPLLKTKNNLLLTVSPKNTGDRLIDHYGETGVFVSYEDYLLILLLIKGREKRIMRSADLIEMNMIKAGETDFTMAKAYTYLHADTKLSIRYLFGSVMPFGQAYEQKGYTGRMHFTNTIYQGY
ncbi:hypothetical protein D7X87_05575 [bacterium D16-54]|nr:hypothetical protein D7X87_05575 [bacterium D16-54]RKJ15878.1 hypothetical protein D7X65_05570 [bacterium D16-56]